MHTLHSSGFSNFPCRFVIFPFTTTFSTGRRPHTYAPVYTGFFSTSVMNGFVGSCHTIFIPFPSLLFTGSSIPSFLNHRNVCRILRISRNFRNTSPIVSLTRLSGSLTTLLSTSYIYPGGSCLANSPRRAFASIPASSLIFSTLSSTTLMVPLIPRISWSSMRLKSYICSASPIRVPNT
ncbi:hypothetical protein ES703_118987 [subsurface metagenome]